MKRNKFEVSTVGISLYFMFGAAAMVLLYLSSVWHAADLLFYILSSLCMVGILFEDKPIAAIVVFVVVGGAALIIMPIPYALVYIMLFGHYPIAAYFFTKMHNKVLSFVLRFLYFNAFAALTYFVLIVPGTLPSEAVMGLPIWALVLILEPAFAVYDFILLKIYSLYDVFLRDKLLR